jgi:zinc/manganese transport system permease protein
MPESGSPRLSWNLAHDLSELLEYHFMVNALLAGAVAAEAAGAVGWMMVVRRQAFAGHTLSVMAFPGASAAALAGVPAAWGYYAVCGAGALAIAGLPAGRRPVAGGGTVAIALVQTVALAAGFLFLSLYGGVLGDLETTLFGNVFGISDGQLLALAAVAAAVLAGLAAIARPLLFASVDAEVAAARGVPVRALAGVFLLLLGLTVAVTSQLTGALLVFALLVGPAASAQALTPRPGAGLALSVALGLLVVWTALAASYFSIYPAGFYVAALSFLTYVGARAVASARARRARAPRAAPPAPPAPGELVA